MGIVDLLLNLAGLLLWLNWRSVKLDPFLNPRGHAETSRTAPIAKLVFSGRVNRAVVRSGHPLLANRLGSELGAPAPIDFHYAFISVRFLWPDVIVFFSQFCPRAGAFLSLAALSLPGQRPASGTRPSPKITGRATRRGGPMAVAGQIAPAFVARGVALAGAQPVVCQA